MRTHGLACRDDMIADGKENREDNALVLMEDGTEMVDLERDRGACRRLGKEIHGE